MKLATVNYQGKACPAFVSRDGQYVLPFAKAEERAGGQPSLPETLLGLIKSGGDLLDSATALYEWAETSTEASGLWIGIDETDLLAPIPRPLKNVLCIGKNYAEHAIEMGGPEDIPEHVMVFTKPPTAVIGSGAGVPSYSSLTEALDYEGELAVVIGKEGKGIKSEDAENHVFGYTIVNDISARDLQARHKQFFLGKSFDGFCPMGPWIVTKDEVGDAGNLSIQTRVNGELRQDSNTRNFIFPIETLIEELSKGMTLEPGDIISTGTPAGVGKGFKPPKYLRAGDCVEITIEKIGVLKNTIEV